ncbi:acetyl-CoA carboxylase biotin carboxyl carrier protein subunit [Bacteroidota bacterium]
MEKEKHMEKECSDIDTKTSQAKKIRSKSLIIDGTKYRTLLSQKFENRKKWENLKNKEIKAFIPGVIRKINVVDGQSIKKGDTLLILEAMKMYNQLKAEKDGIIKSVKIKENQCVIKNQILIELE